MTTPCSVSNNAYFGHIVLLMKFVCDQLSSKHLAHQLLELMTVELPGTRAW